MKALYTILFAAAATLACSAVSPVNEALTEMSLDRNGKMVTVGFALDQAGLQVRSGEAVIISPMIVHGNDTLRLPEVGVYGRRRWIHAERDNRFVPFALKASDKAEVFAYTVNETWADWMDGADLVIASHSEGCCNIPKNPLLCKGPRHYEPIIFTPTPLYVKAAPASEKLSKTREINGRANVEFVVDKTDIRPDYRNNFVELSKIRASIDSVKLDEDVTITGIWLKGFASPESPYKHNTDLARGRVAAVKGYVLDLYNFNPDFITTDFEPEDWAGLREYVVNSNLANREAIIELIDADMDQDLKEKQIKTKYPNDYKHLYTHAYPALRHTDYRINYIIREFTNPEDIRYMAYTSPDKLSVNEFYLAAQDAEPGSPEFNFLYETCLKVHPDDPAANLNAASAAMAVEDYEKAWTLLEKCEDMPEAEYLRGAILLAQGKVDEAEEYLQLAQVLEVEESEEALKTIAKIRERSKKSNTTDEDEVEETVEPEGEEGAVEITIEGAVEPGSEETVKPETEETAEPIKSETEGSVEQGEPVKPEGVEPVDPVAANSTEENNATSVEIEQKLEIPDGQNSVEPTKQNEDEPKGQTVEPNAKDIPD